MSTEPEPVQPRRTETGALLQLALAGAVLIALGLAASQAQRDPSPADDAAPFVDDTTQFDLRDPLDLPDDIDADTLPIDEPDFTPDTTSIEHAPAIRPIMLGILERP